MLPNSSPVITREKIFEEKWKVSDNLMFRHEVNNPPSSWNLDCSLGEDEVTRYINNEELKL